MNLDHFKQNRIKGRDILQQKIVEVFKNLNPVAIHQFGSGSYGYKDEFSDLDIWVTFDDKDIGQIILMQDKIFKSLGTILIKHKSKKNSPLGGSATLIIYETEYGLFHIDFYLSKLSETIIKKDAKVLFGSDALPRGEWKLSPKEVERKSLKKVITYLIVMSFIFIKGVIRKWDAPELIDIIQKRYIFVEEKSGQKLASLPAKISFNLIYRLLKNLYPLANTKQRLAIEKIKDYATTVKRLY